MTPRERAEWMEAVLADESLGAGMKCLAIRLVLHLNMETGRCNPSIARLSAGVGSLDGRTIERSLLRLVQAGWVRRGGRQGTSNQYTFVNIRPVSPPAKTPGVQASTPDTNAGGQGGEPPTKTPGVGHATPDTNAAPPPAFVSGDPRRLCRGNKEENKEGNREETLSLPSLIEVDPSKEAPSSPDEPFETWWGHYPRKVGKHAARKAYDRVLAAGHASAADLLSGVMRYAAERTGQEDRYTKHPTTWLNQGCWADAPLGASAGEAPLSDMWTRRPSGHRDIRQMSNLEIAMAGLWRDEE